MRLRSSSAKAAASTPAALPELIDDALHRAQALLFRELKLAVEPAGAATTAAALGPLRERLGGQRIGRIVCGANIDLDTFAAQVRELLPH